MIAEEEPQQSVAEASLSEQASPDGVQVAVRHAIGWLIVANAVGVYLSLLQWLPSLQAGEWSYGRWMPLHLNLQLYGWTSLPLVAWLFAVYQVGRSRAAAWAAPAVWAWSTALACGSLDWLNGRTSGKLFLDWTGGGLGAFVLAQCLLWWVLMSAWREQAHRWTALRRRASLLGLVGLAVVPLSLWFAASPTVYPPIDRSTGGPTGSSLLGSALLVVVLMLWLPRVTPGVVRLRPADRWVWWYVVVSWLAFGVTEAIGGTHRDPWQIAAMLLLVPWVWWIPRDWRQFRWPPGAAIWRASMLGWWAVLVVSGVAMYQPGVLDRIKFTQALVAHSHLAMAGFTTSYVALTIGLLTGRRLGGWSALLWQCAAFAMIGLLAWMGWREGENATWMIEAPAWRVTGLQLRSLLGLVMLAVSVHWWREVRQ